MSEAAADRPKPGKWRLALVFAALAALAFLPQPALDLAASGLFYRPDGGFWLRDTWPMREVYHGTHWFSIAIIVSLLLALAVTWLPRAFIKATPWRRRLAWTLFAIALGPGLLVHTVLKDHWGRPRPSQIIEFGGNGHYVRPGAISTQCSKNCSFVSGHAASGYGLIALGLLWPTMRRRWTVIGIIAGTAIGAVRIIQGGHFASDVIGSLIVVWATVLWVEQLARTRHTK